MTQNKKYLFNICLAIIAASVTIHLSNTAFFKRLELLSLDAIFRLRFNTQPVSNDIIIIEITADDIRTVGRWPWERSWLAKMTDALSAFGAKDILFDFLMPLSSNEKDDLLFQKAIKEAGNVYLPYYLEKPTGGEKPIIKPIEKFIKYAKGTGFINIAVDIDGSYRRIPLFTTERGIREYNIALQLTMDQLGLKVKEILPNELVLSNSDQKMRIPLVDRNFLLLNWHGKWEETYRRYTFLEVIQAYEDISQGKVPRVDVLPFKNSTCIVALTAIGLYDIKPMPLQSQYPGVGFLATTLSNLHNGYFIRIAPVWINLLFIFMVSLIPALFFFQERPLREILYIVSILAVFFIMYYVFCLGYKMMFSTTLLALFISYVLISAYNFTMLTSLFKKVEVYEKDNVDLEQKNKDLVRNLEMIANKKKELEKLNKELDQFVHTVSHDIRSPLMNILGYADLLQKKIENNLDTNEEEFLDGIFESIDHLNEMIDGLLQTTKISRIRNPYEEVDMNDLVTMIKKRLDFDIKKSGVDLRIQETLPVVVCDRIKMGEVFYNLISNAIKFSSSHKEDGPQVEVGYQEKDNFHEFHVKDNGIGIDPQYHKEIFEMFKRVGQKEGPQGTGVGLCIVKNVITDCGGEVWVKSNPGSGASFYFTIPKDLKSNSS